MKYIVITNDDLEKMINEGENQTLDTMVDAILSDLPEELQAEAKSKCFELCEEQPVVAKKITLKVPNASEKLQKKLEAYNVSVLCVE